MSKIVILAGAPGSGKGELSKFLVQRFGFVTISTGNLLRQEVENRSTQGELIQQTMAGGKLVPDGIVMPIFESELSRLIDLGNTILLDGYPRNRRQAESLIKKLQSMGISPTILFLDVDLQTCQDRILGSRVSAAIANGGQPRIDDNASTLSERMDEYMNVTLPGINAFMFAFKTNTYSLDAKKDLENVASQAENILNDQGFAAA